jgi:hypothetical protein
MPRQKDPSRKIFEAQLGKEIRADQWEAIKTQMREAGMPIIPQNLQFVAKCKRIASRTPVSAPVLTKVITAAAELGVEAYGHQIKTVAFRLNEKLSRDKFYRAFRDCGYPFTVESQFKTQDIGNILYRLLSNQKVEATKSGTKTKASR